MTEETKNASQTKPPAFVAYYVHDSEGYFWTRIGAMWKHKDGDGFTLQLDLVPVGSGRITLRKYQAKQPEQPEQPEQRESA